MAIEKTLKTRIVQKIDTLVNWESSTLPLKKGEIAFATAEINRNGVTKNIILAKVGDGTSTWKQLDYNFYANAADVGDWGNIDSVVCKEGTNGKHTIEYYHGNTLVETADASIFVTHNELADIIGNLVTVGAGEELEESTSGTVKTIDHQEKLGKDFSSTESDKEFKAAQDTAQSKEIKIPKLTVNKWGHVTSIEEETIKLESEAIVVPDITFTNTDDGVVVLETEADGHTITIDAKHKKYHASNPDAVGLASDVSVNENNKEQVINIPYIDVDEYGHVGSVSEHTVTIKIPDCPPITTDDLGTEKASEADTIDVIKSISIDATNKHEVDYLKTPVPTKKYVDDKITDISGDFDDKLKNLHVNIADKTEQDNAAQGYVFAVTNLTEDNNGAHNITPTYTKVPTFEQVEKLATGAVDYLGTVSTQAELNAKVSTASHGDFVRVVINDNSGTFGETYCTGDLLIYNKPNKDTTGVWDLVHGELDQNTWEANSVTADGYVKKTNGAAHKVWKTDANGVPQWLDDTNTDTDTNTKYDIVADASSTNHGYIDLYGTTITKDNVAGTEERGNPDLSGRINFVGGGDNTVLVDTSTQTITIHGTDEKVTSVGNHYTPVKDSQFDVDANSSTSAVWDTTSFVTGITLHKDAAGHITGVDLDSVKMPANPNENTDTTYTIEAKKTTGENSATVSLIGGGTGVGKDTTDSIKIKGGENITISVDQSNPEVITITGEDGNITSKTTIGATSSESVKGSNNTVIGKVYSTKQSHIEGTQENASTTFKANTGLKLTSTAGDHGSITFDFDDEIEFIFDCGNASAR